MGLNPFAGLRLAGRVETAYRIEFVNTVGGGNNWQGLEWARCVQSRNAKS
jgi:hypothetical protein